MGVRFIRLTAFVLALGATACVGVMFVGGVGLLIDHWRGENMSFDAEAVHIGELRSWGLAGIGLFLIAVLLLWITPDRRGKNRSDEGADPE